MRNFAFPFSVCGLGLALLLLIPPKAFAHPATLGACGENCRACHTLATSEAQDILSSFNPALKVLGVKPAAVSGLWQVTYEFGGRKNIIYIDFSKKYLVQGAVININTRQNLTGMSVSELNKVDVSKIPLKDALIIGKPDAPLKVIVFVDPV